ncbi:MAG TPA: SIS domain-containing protein [Candidatus Limnocylindrales bacterium]|nr:SIS domain-containing protein [Candidatus Limnocylindrales bacterium]
MTPPRPRSPRKPPRSGERIRDVFGESVRLLAAVYAKDAKRIERIAGLIADTALRGRTVFWAGNGGSAAEAQHFATELICRYVKNRRALPSIALHADSGTLTAIANDYGFDRVFARPLEALGRRGDLLVALTTSGRSANVLAAVAEARRRGLRVVGMTGARGAAFARRCDHCIVVPSEETARVQEVHLLIGHICCELAEARALQAGGARRRKRR